MLSLAHDMIAYAHRGVRGVVLSGAWTVTGKLVFMQLTGLGPIDVASPGEFFERIEETDGGVHRPGWARRPARVVGEPGYRAAREPEAMGKPTLLILAPPLF